MRSVLLSVILCTTSIALTAISLDYAGDIDMNFGSEGLQINIESGEKQLSQTGDASDDML